MPDFDSRMAEGGHDSARRRGIFAKLGPKALLLKKKVNLRGSLKLAGK
jgi:hypothetical protein